MPPLTKSFLPADTSILQKTGRNSKPGESIDSPGFSVSKNLVEFRPGGRNKMEIHVIRRLCRPETYLSPRKCGICAPLAHKLCAQSRRNPSVRKALAFLTVRRGRTRCVLPRFTLFFSGAAITGAARGRGFPGFCPGSSTGCRCSRRSGARRSSSTGRCCRTAGRSRPACRRGLP